MIAYLILIAAVIAILEAFSRSGTPREARMPLSSMTIGEHALQAWHGAVLLSRLHERGRDRCH